MHENYWMRLPTMRKHGSRVSLEALEERCLLSADMVMQWNRFAMNAVQNDYNVGQQSDQGGPTRTARALAIVQAAVYDAADAVDPIYAPYLFSTQAQPGTSMDAAVAQAAHDTLVALFPQQAATGTFEAELTQSLQGIPLQAAQLGEQLGMTVAAQMLAARTNDGSGNSMTYTPGMDPGQWRPDPLHLTQTALTPEWGAVTPFAIQNPAQYQVPAPPALTSSDYAAAFNFLQLIGGDGVITNTLRKPSQTLIGNFWSYDGSPGLGTPPVEYNEITAIIAQQEGNTPIQNARLFALVNLAMADAGIAAWFTKYTYNFWRPVAAIRESDPGTGPTGLAMATRILMATLTARRSAAPWTTVIQTGRITRLRFRRTRPDTRRLGLPRSRSLPTSTNRTTSLSPGRRMNTTEIP